jgi:putative transposase
VAAKVLDRRFDGWTTNQAWVADITLCGDLRRLALSGLRALGRRKIMGWSMSERMKAALVCDALKMVYWRRKPGAGLIMHSDRGVQYAEHRQLIERYRMIQSPRAVPATLRPHLERTARLGVRLRPDTLPSACRNKS